MNRVLVIIDLLRGISEKDSFPQELQTAREEAVKKIETQFGTEYKQYLAAKLCNVLMRPVSQFCTALASPYTKLEMTVEECMRLKDDSIPLLIYTTGYGVVTAITAERYLRRNIPEEYQLEPEQIVVWYAKKKG